MKGHFEGDWHCEYIDGAFWQIIVPERFAFVVDGKPPIEIPNGMLTDFASTPFGTRNLFPQAGAGNGGAYGPAALPHDIAYVTGMLWGTRVSRRTADRVFKAALDACNVHEWREEVMYWSLRVGGWKAWGRPWKYFDKVVRYRKRVLELTGVEPWIPDEFCV